MTASSPKMCKYYVGSVPECKFIPSTSGFNPFLRSGTYTRDDLLRLVTDVLRDQHDGPIGGVKMTDPVLAVQGLTPKVEGYAYAMEAVRVYTLLYQVSDPEDKIEFKYS